MIPALNSKKHIARCLAMAIALSLIACPAALANKPSKVTVEAFQAEQLKMVVGKSVIVKASVPINRVSVADPEVADYVMLSPRQVYLTGKAPGTTNLTLWNNSHVMSIYDINVTIDVTSLKEEIHRIMPDEDQIRVSATRDAVTLSGTVNNSVNLSQILALAEYYAPDKVNNLMSVGGIQQVMLDVRVSEMTRTLAKNLGINTSQFSRDGANTSLGQTFIDDITANNEDGELYLTDAANAYFSIMTGPWGFTTAIDALKQQGVIKVLAEPTLICISGQNAQFLVGGEFPVPIPQAFGTTAIEWKPYGVGLDFTPTVLNNEKISMVVNPTVSQLDTSNTVNIEGSDIPALSTRRVTTTVELGDGQAFAIAGLLNEEVRNEVHKYPALGEIPILGALFRSTAYQRDETELVIIVVPHLVKPLNTADQPLPTDHYADPDDFELYLLGMIESDEPPARQAGGIPSPSLASKGGLEGEFGHTMP